eukprot:8935780-Lingulodinium_polyedra.AAC.1
MAGRADLLREAGQAGHACFPSSGALSRIDRALANAPARAWITGAELRWDLGIATHAAIQVDFQAQAPEAAWMRAIRPSLEGDAEAGWEQRRDQVTDEVCAGWGQLIEAAA